MLYLLDANALITAHNTWYGQRRVPEFWRWLIHHGEAGTVKMPAEIYAEVEGVSDMLAAWMHDKATKKALLFGEASDPNAVRSVVTAEVSKPERTGARRHVPDVCRDCGVKWMHPVTFIVDLDFSTNWDAIKDTER